MRPLELELVAFGPFLKRQVLSLQELQKKRLFLIEGPVGSGKTFLLDGICFALFGRSSGGERTQADLRSTQAADDVDTLVRLDFEAAAGRYRVERRLSIAAEGDKDALAERVQLWRLPHQSEPAPKDLLSSSVADTELMIESILGLDGNEFCQTSILPQGQFRSFLTASSSERSLILNRMFGGERYQGFTDSLAKKLTQLELDLIACWGERDEITKDYPADSSDPRQRLLRSQEELEAVRDDYKSRKESSLRWQRLLEDAIRYETIERQKDMAERELHVLVADGEQPAHRLLERLDSALPQFKRFRQADKDILALEGDLEPERSRVRNLKSSESFLEHEFSEVQRREEEKFALLRMRERLCDASRELEGLDLLAKESDSAKNRFAELEQVRAATLLEFKKVRKLAKGVKNKLDNLSETELKLSILRQELERLSVAGDRVRQKRQLLDTIAQATERRNRLYEALEDLKARRKTLEKEIEFARARDISQSLALLKELLRPDKECPLCGSSVHPNPFHLKDEIDKSLEVAHGSDIDELTARICHLEEELASCDERKARFQGRLEELGQCDLDQGDILSQLSELRASVSRAEARLSKKELLQEKSLQLQEQLSLSQRKLRQMKVMRERLRLALEAASSQREWRIKRAKEILGESWGDGAEIAEGAFASRLAGEIDNIESRLGELEGFRYESGSAQRLAEEFTSSLAKVQLIKQKIEELNLLRDEIKKELQESFRTDFSSWDDLYFALNRRLRDKRLQGEQEPVLSKEVLAAAVRRQLKQASELLAEVTKPEISANQTRAYLSRELEQVELLTGKQAFLERTIEQGSQDVIRYDSVVERIRELERKKSLLSPLARALRGDNEKDIGFFQWVLERYFQRIVTAANAKLELLAPQRFILVLESNLELRVFDIQAQTSRLTATLSGGEAFLASLSLALGLSEVMQGLQLPSDQLRTIFIDEGFGSLDQEATEAALRCLESLPSAGYCVGLVSHAITFKERIGDQIRVSTRESAGAGSRVEICLS